MRAAHWMRAISCPTARAQRLEQLALARLDPLGRREHLLLVLLERRRDVPLAAGQRLPALIVRGHEMPVRVR